MLGGVDMVVNNTDDLKIYLDVYLRKAFNNSLDKMVEVLKDIIDRKVYSAYQPIFYNRTYQLREAWGKEVLNVRMCDFIGKINHLSDLITFEGIPFFEHGSYISAQDWLGDDNAIPYIVNSGNIGDAFNFPQLGAREFWEEFKKYFKDNFINVLKTELKNYGFKVT
jgi:hypothetical protein